MDRRRTSKIIENKGGFAVVNKAEKMLKVATSFDHMTRNLNELHRVMDKTRWL
jgi:tRNA1(Val) A37 N6-methylase TrmN6